MGPSTCRFCGKCISVKALRSDLCSEDALGAIDGSRTDWPRPAEPLASVFARHGKGIFATPLLLSAEGVGRRAGASGAVCEASPVGDTASRHHNAAMKIPGISTTPPTGPGHSRCCVPRYVVNTLVLAFRILWRLSNITVIHHLSGFVPRYLP
jgi:hypothetical protein